MISGRVLNLNQPKPGPICRICKERYSSTQRHTQQVNYLTIYYHIRDTCSALLPSERALIAKALYSVDQATIDGCTATKKKYSEKRAERRRSDPQYAQHERDVAKRNWRRRSDFRLNVQNDDERDVPDAGIDASEMASIDSLPDAPSRSTEWSRRVVHSEAAAASTGKAACAKGARPVVGTDTSQSGSSDSTLPDYPSKVIRAQFRAPRRRERAADTRKLEDGSESSDDGNLPLKRSCNVYVAFDCFRAAQATLIHFSPARHSKKHHGMVARKSSRHIRRVVLISSSEDESMRVVASANQPRSKCVYLLTAAALTEADLVCRQNPKGPLTPPIASEREEILMWSSKFLPHAWRDR